ncbi:hypothetical protein EXIGLDRAFT_609893 [Exidia glandulosa HHB12029]|uniref:UbiA prenyltransferase n=1 Tax=Exidia glandulosa HHB12029 TaxID=1314781 RepID=A0A165K7P0_EXIGL|nr:hypothetical protein EXIGLDRAFT_609893 [Exidia glandulosa HHB12029]
MLAKLGYHAHTLFLFTYSDYKTIFIPVSVFAAATAPVSSITRFGTALIWLWLHLLQFDVSNQYTTAKEDAANKPWRPMPSGRLSREHATVLRWSLLIACNLLSITIATCAGTPDVICISTAMSIAILAHNEVGLAQNWLGKNVCCAVGYMVLEAGTTLITSTTLSLSDDAKLSILISALVIASTIQVQDFPDVEGDLAMGRKTFPIAFPRFSRLATSVTLAAWSLAMGWIWQLHQVMHVTISSLGLWVAIRVLLGGGPAYDRVTYVHYNLWLVASHLLPIASRLV